MSENKNLKESTITVFAISLVVSGLLIMIIFFYETYNHYSIASSFQLPDMAATGEMGDFIGGLVGTLFSLVGVLLLFITLRDQRESFKKERFENHFFELIKLHRENISELKYEKYENEKMNTSENRKVFTKIIDEFKECLFDVRHFLNSVDPDDYYTIGYKQKISNIYKKNNLSVNLIELATIDIAYCIIFFGVSIDGEIVLRNIFSKKYKSEYYLHLLNFIRLKPKAENNLEYINWLELRNKPYLEFRQSLSNIYWYGKPGHNINLSAAETQLMLNFKLFKYYGGHQHRLGHYFRHLFQSYKFLNNQPNLNRKDKYVYGKTLRAQLSTHEQILLFINSISSLGMAWELNPANNDNKKETVNEKKNKKLITEYNLIKNVSGIHFYKIYYKHFYPNVEYESDKY